VTAASRIGRVLVTGGCGFVGSHFIRHLLRTHPEATVINLDKLTYAGDPSNLADVEQACGRRTDSSKPPRYRFVRGDICDRSLLARILEQEQGCVDTIVHFAAETHVDRSIERASPFIQTNIVGTQVLLEAVQAAWEARSSSDTPGAAGPRFLYVSTDEVYGPSVAGQTFKETSPLRPTSPYAASKASAELICQSYAQTYGIPVLIARLSNQYGPNQLPEKLIPKAISNLLSGQPIPIYGRGKERRTWTYVDDTCHALVQLLAGRIHQGIFNMPGLVERRNIDLIQQLIAIFDRLSQGAYVPPMGRERIRFVEDPRSTVHDSGYRMDATKAASAIGWDPQTSIQDGLQRTVTWYLSHREWLRRASQRLAAAAASDGEM